MSDKNQTPDLISDKTLLIKASCDLKPCPVNIDTRYVTTAIYDSTTSYSKTYQEPGLQSLDVICLLLSFKKDYPVFWKSFKNSAVCSK